MCPSLAFRESSFFSVNSNRALASLHGSSQHSNIRLRKQQLKTCSAITKTREMCQTQDQLFSTLLLHYNPSKFAQVRCVWPLHGTSVHSGQLITGGQWGEIQPMLCRTRHRSGACVHPERLPPPYGIELAPNIYLPVPWFVPSPPPQSPRKHLKHTPPIPLTREYTPFSWHDLRGLELGLVFGGPLFCFANPSHGKQFPLFFGFHCSNHCLCTSNISHVNDATGPACPFSQGS